MKKTNVIEELILSKTRIKTSEHNSRKITPSLPKITATDYKD